MCPPSVPIPGHSRVTCQSSRTRASPDLINSRHWVHDHHFLLGPGHDVRGEDKLAKALEERKESKPTRLGDKADSPISSGRIIKGYSPGHTPPCCQTVPSVCGSCRGRPCPAKPLQCCQTLPVTTKKRHKMSELTQHPALLQTPWASPRKKQWAPFSPNTISSLKCHLPTIQVPPITIPLPEPIPITPPISLS